MYDSSHFNAYTSTLAHEIGHFFGLPHSFNTDSVYSPGSESGLLYARKHHCTSTSPVRQLTGRPLYQQYSCEPVLFLGSTLWCIISGNGFSKFRFAILRRLIRTTNGAGSLHVKNRELKPLCAIYPGTNTNCTFVAGSGQTQMSCDINNTTYTTPSVMLNGLSFAAASGSKVTGNLMSYDIGAFTDQPNMKLAASQIGHIRRALRYEVTNRVYSDASFLPTGGGYSAQIAKGGRPFLQRQNQRSLSSDLDFDGDGHRDVAVWEPPIDTSPATYGTFRIRLWRHFSTGNNTEYTIPFGRLGDIPIPGHYDANGTTDLAVITKYDRGNPTNDSVSWRVRYCSFIPAFIGPPPFYIHFPDTLNCPAPTGSTDGGLDISHLGSTGDQFFADLGTRPKCEYERVGIVPTVGFDVSLVYASITVRDLVLHLSNGWYCRQNQPPIARSL